ncbi:hypothetical protein GQ457_07G018290 [Hibiscus cannabinus]
MCNFELSIILYGNGKPIRRISDTSIQLVRTCLVLNWDQDNKSSSVEEICVSFVEVRSDICGNSKICRRMGG